MALTLQIISDIHLEFIRDEAEISFDSIAMPSAKVLALLGDIATHTTIPFLETFLLWCKERWEYVLYLPGNHEYYNKNMKFRVSMSEVDCQLENLCIKTGVTWLANKVIDIEGHRFIGSTLWSNVPVDYRFRIEMALNDYRLICVSSDEPLSVEATNALYEQNRNFIISALESSISDNISSVIVLTHHTPCMLGTSDPKYDDSSLRFAFSTDISLPNHLKEKIRFWCCGHTHYNFNLLHSAGGREYYRLLSNQRGYFFENEVVSTYKRDFCLAL